MLDTIRRHNLLQPGEGIVVGVSGGADSVALLALLREIADSWRLQLCVAHLNHGLRADAAADARFVQDLCAAWGLPFVSEVADVRGYARERHLSVEAAAREVRYEFLARAAAARGYATLAVGHTADDQAETMLLRLVRDGRPGGMWARRPLGNGALVRPLLDCWRRDLRAMLAARGLSWREDPTNLDRRIQRNQVRHDLIPILAGYIPEVQNRLKQSADLLAADDAALEAAAAAAESVVFATQGDTLRLDRRRLLEQPPALRWRLVRRAVRRAGGNIRRLHFVVIEEALRLARDGSEGQRVSLPGLVLEARGTDLLLGPLHGAPPAGEFVIPVEGRIDAEPFGIVVDSAVLPAEATDLADGAAYLDADCVRRPIVLRAWRPGDRFRPLGMRGMKKVGDFLTDAKVPRLLRARIPVVQSADGAIVWLVGWRVAEDARVTGQTHRVVRLRARPRTAGNAAGGFGPRAERV